MARLDDPFKALNRRRNKCSWSLEACISNLDALYRHRARSWTSRVRLESKRSKTALKTRHTLYRDTSCVRIMLKLKQCSPRRIEVNWPTKRHLEYGMVSARGWSLGYIDSSKHPIGYAIQSMKLAFQIRLSQGM